MSEEILTRAKNGDRKGQHELYNLYADSIFTLCMRLTSDRVVAEDALQMIFMEVFKSIKNFEGRASIYTWIRSIAIRQCYRLIKNKGVVFESIDNLAEIQEIEPPSFEKKEDLQRAFEQLSSGYRTILTLFYLEEMSHAEISEQLGISQGTSKSQLFHAKKRLKKLLEQ